MAARLVRRLEERLGRFGKGVTGVEYGLLTFLVSAVLIPPLIVLGPSIGATFSQVTVQILPSAATTSATPDPTAAPTVSPTPDPTTAPPSPAPTDPTSAPAVDPVEAPLLEAWIPPSVVTADGVAPPLLAVDGTTVPLSPGTDPADVHTPASVNSGACTRHFPSWGWSGAALTVDVSSSGPNPSNCDTAGQLPWPTETVGCLITSRWHDAKIGRWREVGEVMPETTKPQSFKGNALAFSNSTCKAGNHATIWWMYIPANATTAGSGDGLLAFRPGVTGSTPPIVRAVTTCTDGSTVAATFASGASVAAALCLAGSPTSIALSASGTIIGSVAVAVQYQGNHCLSAVGLCGLVAASGTSVCVSGGPAGSCDWWNPTVAPERCEWRSGANLWASLQGSDCSDAAAKGFFPTVKHS